MRSKPFLVGLCLSAHLAISGAAIAQSIDGLEKIAPNGSLGKDLASGVKMIREPWSNAKDYGMVVATAPHPLRTGEKSLRMELHWGDCGKVPEWDDCRHGNERVELVSSPGDWMKANSRASYGWSIYLPEDWNTKELSQIVMGQFHQADSSPAFQFFYQSQGGGLQVQRRVDEKRPGLGTDVRTIIDDKALRGRWHDIGVEAYWRKKDDGYFRVSVNGQQVYEYKGKTMSGSRVFFKLGIYRISPNLKATDLVVYYDDISRKK